MSKKHLAFVLAFFVSAQVISACSETARDTSAPANAPARMTNDELDRIVTARINTDATLAVYNLDVDADAEKNAVTLSGSVPTQSMRAKAVDAARTAHAGLTITDKIDVKPGDVDRKDYTEDMAREARQRASESKESIGDSLDDAWIHTKIRTKLLAEGEFPAGGVNVDVSNNVVTLRGSVSTAGEKTEAGDIARATEGVKSVRNQLVVKP